MAKISERQNRGRRLQIRGFPKIWADELTFDEISWWLYDLLQKYGLIDNISVSQSKKDQIIYGIVDMLREKDATKVTNELLDENSKLYLHTWNSTLSFLQLPANNASTSTKGSQENLAARSNALYNRKSKSLITPLFGGGTHQIMPLMTTVTNTQSDIQISAKPNIMYSREKLLAIRDMVMYSREQFLALRNTMA